MEKMVVLRSIYRAACLRSSLFATATAAANQNRHFGSRSFFSVSSPSASNPPRNLLSGGRSSFALRLCSMRYISEDVTHMPVIKDPEVQNVFKDLMAGSWDELPYSVVQDTKKALSKDTDDKAGQEALKNVFRAAAAVEEFGGVLMSMKMELDDSIGLSGENVKPLSSEFVDALNTVYQRYTTYLEAFGPDETYLRKKVETELGSKMIYLKMRCSGLGSEWGKITVLGTSGLSGSYVEQRA
ncbi:succinate dehydrogenase subunit 5, mitochondrial-like [Durio zibethinus]|uniref:Succinate dehydrogenase subunit 5, mitochondrial-like n=1 Tax=Durio zibethinus TaxID=66656 RepID=A0A6P6B7G9_DURZI|nr:succinate dehydrogenase subunit 5, mitochondrial-like [Durio zibethinus]